MKMKLIMENWRKLTEANHEFEGPFKAKDGRALYYDPAKGKYYDRDADIYLDPQEAEALMVESCEDDEEIEEDFGGEDIGSEGMGIK